MSAKRNSPSGFFVKAKKRMIPPPLDQTKVANSIILCASSCPCTKCNFLLQLGDFEMRPKSPKQVWMGEAKQDWINYHRAKHEIEVWTWMDSRPNIDANAQNHIFSWNSKITICQLRQYRVRATLTSTATLAVCREKWPCFQRLKIYITKGGLCPSVRSALCWTRPTARGSVCHTTWPPFSHWPNQSVRP